MCNIGTTPSFQRENSSSIIDITIASPALVNRINNWSVLDIESLSNHNYIYFEIENTIPTPINNRLNTRRVDIQTLETVLTQEKLITETYLHSAEQSAESLTTNIQQMYKDMITPTPANS